MSNATRNVCWKDLVVAGTKLCWAGFWAACTLERAFQYISSSKEVRVRTFKCFLLNGLLFIGSMGCMRFVVVPVASWMLHLTPPHNLEAEEELRERLMAILDLLYKVLWLYPAYILSFIVNDKWYHDIAKFAVTLHQQERLTSSVSSNQSGPAESLYSVVLVTVFFVQAVFTSFLPLIGKPLYYLNLSLLYGYYCFDYKWVLAGWSLEQRINFFEINWSYFMGFGGPFTLLSMCFPKLIGAGLMAVMFPLCVLVALRTDVNQVVSSTLPLGRLPVFRFAASQATTLIQLLLGT